MASRDDSYLNTGLSSALERRQAAKKHEQVKEKQKRQEMLRPSAEIVLQWIDQEKADVVNLEKIILNVSDEKFLQAQLLARQLHLEFLTALKNKARNMLRTLPKDEDDA